MENQESVVQENYICVMRDKTKKEESRMLLVEHHMRIAINEEQILDVMCTPEYLEELILGRLLTEGIIHSEEDVWELEITSDGMDANITVAEYESPVKLKHVKSIMLPEEQIFRMAEEMAKGMPLHEVTWGTHSCFLFREGRLIFSCEDLGRHNAMDKVIGYALKQEIPLQECAVYTSGRVPTDMAEKAIRSGIPVLVSKGVPTRDAVELAREYELTLICGARSDQMRIYTDFRKKGLDAMILAGGKSSRMGGKHKGSLKIGKETFTQHLIKELSKEVEKVWISYGKDVHEIYAGCEIVTDYYKDCGPMGGLHAGLLSATSNYVFVAACDMPFLQAEFVELLKQYIAEDVDVVVPSADGRIHPLAAIYSKKILPVVEQHLKDGNYKLRSLLAELRVTYVEIEDMAIKNMLQNINTIEEYHVLSDS